jgi:hypothetical protein
MYGCDVFNVSGKRSPYKTESKTKLYRSEPWQNINIFSEKLSLHNIFHSILNFIITA